MNDCYKHADERQATHSDIITLINMKLNDYSDSNQRSPIMMRKFSNYSDSTIEVKSDCKLLNEELFSEEEPDLVSRFMKDIKVFNRELIRTACQVMKGIKPWKA